MRAAYANDPDALSRAEPRVDPVAAPAIVRFLAYLAIAISGFVQVEPAPTDLVFMCLLGVLCFYGSSSLRLRGIGFSIVFGLIVIVIGNLISLMPAFYAIEAFRYVLITVYLIMMFLLVIGLIGRHGPSFGHLCLRAFCLAALMVSIIGILARFRLIPNPEAFYRDESGLRVRSTFKDPNVFAPFVVAAIIIVLNDVVTRRRRLLPGVLISSVYFVAVMFAFSRGAFLNLAIALMVYAGACMLVVRDRDLSRRLGMALVLGGVIALAGVVYLLALTDMNAFLEERLAMQGYDNDRFAMQRLTLDVAIDWPLGVGPGEWPARYQTDPHNVYLRLLAENGFIGVLGFLVWIAGCLLKAAEGVWARSSEAPTHAACLAVSLGILVESFVIDSFHWRFFFLFLAIPIGLRIHERSRPAPRPARGRA